MDEQQLRLECLREARIHVSHDRYGKVDVLELAQQFFDFASKREKESPKE